MEHKNEVAHEVPVQEQLSYYELREIKESILHILASNNLSIRQSRKILEKISNDFEDCIPWKSNYSSSENDQL